MPDYVIGALLRTAISDAFPIMHLVMPGLDLQAWQRFARASLHTSRDRPAGILIARRSIRRHVCGLVCYRMETDLAYGRIIAARHLIAADILNNHTIMLLLVRHLARMARASFCTGVHIRVPHGETALLDVLDDEGLRTRLHGLRDIEIMLEDLPPDEAVQGG